MSDLKFFKLVERTNGVDRIDLGTKSSERSKKKVTNFISLELSFFRFKDANTGQIIYYVPSLEISSYGATQDKANKMMGKTLNEYFKQLTSNSPDQIKLELEHLGWEQNSELNKNYSNAFINIEGRMQNFNIEKDSIERMTSVV